MMSADATDAMVNEAYTRAIETSTARALLACPPLVPLPAQVRILQTVVARARVAGLELPTFTVHWVGGRQGICDGAAGRDANGEYFVFLNALAGPDDLRRTIAHELQHVHDFAAGATFTRLELEQRAITFAAAMQRGRHE